MFLFLLVTLIQGKIEYRNLTLNATIVEVNEGKAVNISYNPYAVYEMNVYYEGKVIKSHDQGEIIIHEPNYEMIVQQEINVDFKIIDIIFGDNAIYLLSETCKIYYFDKNNGEIKEVQQLEKDCLAMKYQQNQDSLYIEYQKFFIRYSPWRQSYTKFDLEIEKKNNYFIDNFGKFLICKDNGLDYIQYAGEYLLKDFLSEFQILQAEIHNTKILIILTNQDIRTYSVNEQQLSQQSQRQLNYTSLIRLENPISFLIYQQQFVIIQTQNHLFQVDLDFTKLTQLYLLRRNIPKILSYNLNDINVFYIQEQNLAFQQHSILELNKINQQPTKMKKIAGSRREQTQEFVVLFNESTIQIAKIQYNIGYLIINPSKTFNLLIEFYSKICSKIEQYSSLQYQCRIEIPLQIIFIPNLSKQIYQTIISIALILIVLLILIRRYIIRKRKYYRFESIKKPQYII